MLVNNTSSQRYEIEVDGQIVFSDYEREGSTVSLTHVQTPVALRGRGAAGKLMEGIVELARAEGLKLHPVCPYAVAWLERHPEHGDLVV